MKTNKLYKGLIALLLIAFAAQVFSQARVQVIHNSADAAAETVDVWLNDMGRESASMAGNTDVLVFHGSTDAPVVDVAEVGVGAGTIIDNLA